MANRPRPTRLMLYGAVLIAISFGGIVVNDPLLSFTSGIIGSSVFFFDLIRMSRNR